MNEKQAADLGELVGLLAEPTRLRILFALLDKKALAVSGLAKSLAISDDAASYNLKILRLSGLVTSRRDGRTIIYSLAPTFPHQLLEHCLKQLLEIAETRGR
jgi:DNA-binding transcriptional ArsR family regulator